MVALEMSESFRSIGETTLRVLIIFLAATVIRALVHRAIARSTRRMRVGLEGSRIASNIAGELAVNDGGYRVDARSATVSAMMRSLSSWIIYVVATLMILGELRINLGPLLAGAGVAGIAVGFGAQSLVRDVLAGFFVMVEDQYGVGDIIDAGPATGTVERMSLRSTQIRDLAGTVWHIPNGTIARVGNKSQNWARAVVEVVVSHAADIRMARATMSAVAAEMAAEPEWAAAMRIGGEADDQGISALTPAGITLRLVVDTEPSSQWGVERELRLRIKEAFDEAGIPLEVHQ